MSMTGTTYIPEDRLSNKSYNKNKNSKFDNKGEGTWVLLGQT